MPATVLDSFALIAYFRGEPAGVPVKDLLQKAGRSEKPLHMTEVNYAEVKWRYRSPAVPAAVEETEHGFRLELEAPAYGVAAGQTAVLYDDDVVVGAGLL